MVKVKIGTWKATLCTKIYCAHDTYIQAKVQGIKANQNSTKLPKTTNFFEKKFSFFKSRKHDF